MNLTFWIASRLKLKAENKEQRSPGITIAVAGVAVSIAVMIISVAVVMGFKNNIKEKLLGLESAIVIEPANKNSALGNTFIPSESLLSSIRDNLPPGAEVSESTETTALLKTDSDYLGITLRANSPGSAQEGYIKRNIVSGEYPDYSSGKSKSDIVVSSETARLLGLAPGDRLRLHFFADNAVRTRPARVAAIYDTSFSERDRLLAFAPRSMILSAEKLPEGSVSSINVSGISEPEIDEVCSSLQETLLMDLYNNDTGQLLLPMGIRQRAAMYFNWLDLLDTNVVVIIILMGLVAAFTLISCLLILILERISFIGIMKALGATNGNIRRIFIALALRVVVLGLAIGNIAGFGILLVQQKFKLIPLDSQAYFLDSVPVEIIPGQMIVLNVAAIIVSAAVLLIPTSIISTISPASTIKYE